MMRVLLAAIIVHAVIGHGSMSFPRPRNAKKGAKFAADASCVGDACYWYQVGCFNGCSNCTSTGKYLYAEPSDYPEGCTPMEPTNNEPAHRSWDPHGHSKHGDFTKHNPWRAPGHAPVVDPCGDASGYLPGAQKGAAIPEGYAAFSRGSEVLPEGDVTVWRSGGSAEVAWAIAAQHGGGYSYRICPKKAGQVLSEECFQAHPLEFTGATHTIRYNDGSRKDFAINASTVSEGTKPAGSSWRRNPIPACNCDIGEGCSLGGKGFSEAYANDPDPMSKAGCPTGTMFPAQWDEGYGAGALTSTPFHFSIVDRIRVPSTPGDYVLSWRWDCEQTNQVWNSCADIRISDTEPVTPYPSPAPPAPPTPPKPIGKGCKAMENPTCKGVAASAGKCPYIGCSKCKDDDTWNCETCCDACVKTHDDDKKIDFCAPRKEFPFE